MGTARFGGLVVFCNDIAASARFYEEGLGLQREWADDSHVGLRAPVAAGPDSSIWMLLHPSDEPRPADLGTWEVDDVDAIIADLRRAGYTVRSEPEDAPWGVREAGVVDPDGNGLLLTGPVRSVTA